MRIFYKVLVLSLLATGCATNARQPAVHDFGQDTGKTTTEQKPVINVDAPSWLWDSRIRYRLLFAAPSQVRFYGQDDWIAAPPELFQQKLISSVNAYTFRLLVRLQAFEQQFDTADKAHVLLHFSVEAYSADNKNKIAEQEFKLEQASKSPNAQGAIDGFTDLTQQAVSKLQIWLAGLAAAQ